MAIIIVNIFRNVGSVRAEKNSCDTSHKMFFLHIRHLEIRLLITLGYITHPSQSQSLKTDLKILAMHNRNIFFFASFALISIPIYLTLFATTVGNSECPSSYWNDIHIRCCLHSCRFIS